MTRITPGTPPDNDPASGVPFWQDPWLWAVVALAAVLRLIRLGYNDLWHDEVHNLLCAEFLADLLRYGHLASNHPPLPYILLRGWRELGFGPDEFSLRLLPALAGTLGVVTLYLLAELLFDRLTARWAALLLAVSPFHILHSQDLKEYIYLPTLAPLVGYFLVRAIREHRAGFWIAYGVLAGLGCYTEAFVAPLLVTLNLWAMAILYMDSADRRAWIGWFAGNLLGAAMFAPWLAIMLRKAVATMVEATRWWIPAPGWLEVVVYLKTIAYGYCYLPLPAAAAVCVFAVLALWGVYAAWITGRQREAILAALWCLLPITIVFAISQVTQSIFLLRALLPYAMGVYLLAGLGARFLPLRHVGTAGLLLLPTLAGLGQYYARDYTLQQFPHRPGVHPPQPFHAAAAFVASHWQEGDLVLQASHANWLPFLWYGLRDHPMKNAGTCQGFIDYFENANPRNTPNPIMDGYFPEPIESQVRGYRRVWFVYGEWERESLGDHALMTWRWMDSHYTETDRAAFGDIEIRLYEPRELRPVLARIRDNGVAAEEILGPDSTRRITLLPDATLEGHPPRVPEQVTAEGAPLGLLLELDPETGRARLISRRNTSIRCVVAWARSVNTLSAATFLRDNLGQDIWLPSARYNPTPPPAFWMPTTLNGHPLHGPGSASLRVTLPPGTYRLWAELMGPAPSERYLVAPASLSVNGVDVLRQRDSSSATDSGTSPGDSPPAWQWYEGTRPFTVPQDQPVDLRISVAPLPGPEPGWANFSTALIVPDTVSTPPVQQKEIQLEPGDVYVIDEILSRDRPPDMRRLDVWVWPVDVSGLALRVFTEL